MHSRIDSRLITLAFGDGEAPARVVGRRRGDGPPLDALLRAAVEVAVGSHESPLMLAISGGRDSMALLHAMVRWAPGRIAAVATFDHGTGGPATEAASLVASESRRLGVTVVRERARSLVSTEHAWRQARWDFLGRVSRAYRARVVTAHTRDDQLETIVMRLLRGSGARGLAALAAPSEIVRPWLPVTREEVASWVALNGVPFIEDPSNLDPRHLRVRVRRDLLPALETAQPGFAESMLAIAERAALWRRDLDRLLDESGAVEPLPGGRLRVAATLFDGVDDEVRVIYWQALFGRAGVALDARGTRELVRFSRNERRGSQLQLAGGATALLTRDGSRSVFEVRPPTRRNPAAPPTHWTGAAAMLPRRVGRWRFRRCDEQLDRQRVEDDEAPWTAALPAEGTVTIRPWEPGDRLLVDESRARRRVARYFVEAGVPAPDRPDWPVVLLGDEVVWVPGVCRSRAAPFRPGRPDMIWYRCERELS